MRNDNVASHVFYVTRGTLSALFFNFWIWVPKWCRGLVCVFFCASLSTLWELLFDFCIWVPKWWRGLACILCISQHPKWLVFSFLHLGPKMLTWFCICFMHLSAPYVNGFLIFAFGSQNDDVVLHVFYASFITLWEWFFDFCIWVPKWWRCFACVLCISQHPMWLVF